MTSNEPAFLDRLYFHVPSTAFVPACTWPPLGNCYSCIFIMMLRLSLHAWRLYSRPVQIPIKRQWIDKTGFANIGASGDTDLRIDIATCLRDTGPPRGHYNLLLLVHSIGARLLHCLKRPGISLNPPNTLPNALWAICIHLLGIR